MSIVPTLESTIRDLQSADHAVIHTKGGGKIIGAGVLHVAAAFLIEQQREIEALRAAQQSAQAAADARDACPDDLRSWGWSVAVHNDYRLSGEAHTFWLFTKDGQAVKGEGRTDAEALNQVRAAIATRQQGARE